MRACLRLRGGVGFDVRAERESFSLSLNLIRLAVLQGSSATFLQWDPPISAAQSGILNLQASHWLAAGSAFFLVLPLLARRPL